MCYHCFFPYLAVALHGRCGVDCVAVQAVTWHLMSHHSCHNHAGVDPFNHNNGRVHSVERQHKHTDEFTHIPPTNTDLYVVAIGGIFQVIDGAHHVQGHVANVMCVVLSLLRSASNHHVGISNSLNLKRSTTAAFTREEHSSAH